MHDEIDDKHIKEIVKKIKKDPKLLKNVLEKIEKFEKSRDGNTLNKVICCCDDLKKVSNVD